MPFLSIMNSMKILIACEESQVVCTAFRNKGHEAYSCDTEPCSGSHPEWHLQKDVLPLLQDSWNMIIAFPPCTHLAVSGARYFEQKRKDGRQQQGIDFFMAFVNCRCSKIAIENPVDFNPVSLGDSINTSSDEYWPAITADDEVLLFTRQVHMTSKQMMGPDFQEDFFMSRRSGASWMSAVNLGSPLNTGPSPPCSRFLKSHEGKGPGF